MLYLVLALVILITLMVLSSSYLSDTQRSPAPFKENLLLGLIFIVLIGSGVGATRGNIASVVIFGATLVMMRRVLKKRAAVRGVKDDVDTSATGMSRREALALLNLTETATVDDIKKAYRRKMQRNHPDKGGTAEAAAKLNEAKRVLLEK